MFLKKMWYTFYSRKMYHVSYCTDENVHEDKFDDKYYAKQNENTKACCKQTKMECRVDNGQVEEGASDVRRARFCFDPKLEKGKAAISWNKAVEACCKKFGGGWAVDNIFAIEADIVEKCK